MAYRNGVYVAFNGCGTTNPTESDIHYFNLLKAWSENKKIDFSFVDSHQKTYKVLDSSTRRTLLDRLDERLRNSKLLLLIVTQNTINSSEIVDHEINRAVDLYKIPIVVAYTDQVLIQSVNSHLKSKLPYSLQRHIKDNKTKILFIPFKLNAIDKAIKQFGVNQLTSYSNGVYCYPDITSWD